MILEPSTVTSVPNSAALVIPTPPEFSFATSGKLTSPGNVKLSFAPSNIHAVVPASSKNCVLGLGL